MTISAIIIIASTAIIASIDVSLWLTHRRTITEQMERWGRAYPVVLLLWFALGVHFIGVDLLPAVIGAIVVAAGIEIYRRKQ